MRVTGESWSGLRSMNRIVKLRHGRSDMIIRSSLLNWLRSGDGPCKTGSMTGAAFACVVCLTIDCTGCVPIMASGMSASGAVPMSVTSAMSISGFAVMTAGAHILVNF